MKNAADDDEDDDMRRKYMPFARWLFFKSDVGPRGDTSISSYMIYQYEYIMKMTKD